MQTKKVKPRPFYFPLSDDPAPQILFIQHFNLLCDRRMGALEKAINDLVSEEDIVVDLGAGTGILAMIAARKAKKVWAVELDPHLAEYAQNAIKKNGFSNKIVVINDDAKKVDIPEKVDLIIAEMLDTALIKEQLIQVMNASRKRLSNEKTKIIPSKVFTSVALSHTDFSFSGLYMPLPYFETLEVRKTTDFFSQSILYHTVDLYRDNPINVDVSLEIPVNRTGEVNSIKIMTDVELYPGFHCCSSPWFNPPLVLPTEPFQIKVGDIVHLKLSYLLGEGLRSLDYEVMK